VERSTSLQAALKRCLSHGSPVIPKHCLPSDHDLIDFLDLAFRQVDVTVQKPQRFSVPVCAGLWETQTNVLYAGSMRGRFCDVDCMFGALEAHCGRVASKRYGALEACCRRADMEVWRSGRALEV